MEYQINRIKFKVGVKTDRGEGSVRVRSNKTLRRRKAKADIHLMREEDCGSGEVLFHLYLK